MNGITIGIFAAILALTLAITAWAARRTRTATDFYAVGKGLTAAQNGFAWRVTGAAPPLSWASPG
jgi:cation/acetate symporter